ncbi:hypothetical protein AAC387_Pa12g0453 [Persea americana]
MMGAKRRSYKASKATMKNRGHDKELEWEEGAGVLNKTGTEYILKRCHWHSPSEHTVDARSYFPSIKLELIPCNVTSFMFFMDIILYRAVVTSTY